MAYNLEKSGFLYKKNLIAQVFSLIESMFHDDILFFELKFIHLFEGCSYTQFLYEMRSNDDVYNSFLFDLFYPDEDRLKGNGDILINEVFFCSNMRKLEETEDSLLIERTVLLGIKNIDPANSINDVALKIKKFLYDSILGSWCLLEHNTYNLSALSNIPAYLLYLPQKEVPLLFSSYKGSSLEIKFLEYFVSITSSFSTMIKKDDVCVIRKPYIHKKYINSFNWEDIKRMELDMDPWDNKNRIVPLPNNSAYKVMNYFVGNYKKLGKGQFLLDVVSYFMNKNGLSYYNGIFYSFSNNYDYSINSLEFFKNYRIEYMLDDLIDDLISIIILLRAETTPLLDNLTDEQVENLVINNKDYLLKKLTDKKVRLGSDLLNQLNIGFNISMGNGAWARLLTTTPHGVGEAIARSYIEYKDGLLNIHTKQFFEFNQFPYLKHKCIPLKYSFNINFKNAPLPKKWLSRLESLIEDKSVYERYVNENLFLYGRKLDKVACNYLSSSNISFIKELYLYYIYNNLYKSWDYSSKVDDLMKTLKLNQILKYNLWDGTYNSIGSDLEIREMRSTWLNDDLWNSAYFNLSKDKQELVKARIIEEKKNIKYDEEKSALKFNLNSIYAPYFILESIESPEDQWWACKKYTYSMVENLILLEDIMNKKVLQNINMKKKITLYDFYDEEKREEYTINELKKLYEEIPEIIAYLYKLK